MPNEISSADVGWRVLFAAEFLRSAFMRCSTFLFIFLALLTLTACGLSSEERSMKAKCESLVKQRATTNAVIEAFGAAPKHVYSRAEALEWKKRQPGVPFWERVSQYPWSYSYPMYSGDVLVHFDESNRASAFYLNIQL